MKLRNTLFRSARHLLGLSLLLLLSGSLCPAAAESSSCKLSGATMELVRYVDKSADLVLCNQSPAAAICRLSGWLYKPAGKGPFPTIVLSHSAENPRKESDYCQITEYFLSKGYLVFQPLRRGYSGDAGIGQNTGELTETTLQLLAAGKPSKSPLAPDLLAKCNQRAPTLTAGERDCVATKLQESEALELRLALDAIKQLGGNTRWVDRAQVALVGDAEGANISALVGDIYGRDPNLGVRAGALLSLGERTWDNSHQQEKDRIIKAVKQRAFPLAFLQPANAENVDSTKELADAAVNSNNHQFMASLLPDVLGLGAMATKEQIHKWFATREESVTLWAPLVRQFFQVHGAGKPPGDTQNGKHETKAEHNSKVTTMCDRLTPGMKVTEETYYDPSNSPKPELCNDKDGELVCRLKGILYVPENAHNAPAIILNNGGHEKVKSEDGFCTITEYFTSRGFVVFLPRRRGITQSEATKNHPEEHFVFQNTGKTPDEVRAAVEKSHQTGSGMPREAKRYEARCHLAWIDPKPFDWDCLSGELLRDEAVEVGEAIKWLKKQKASGGLLVDPAKIAIMGHSNGGQVVLHAGAILDGDRLPKVIIAVSPHEKGWKTNKYKQDLLRTSVEKAQVPFAIFRPENAPTLYSTEVLGKIAAETHAQFLTQIFPPMMEKHGEDSNPHVHFVTEFEQVVKWANTARLYLQVFGIAKGEP